MYKNVFGTCVLHDCQVEYPGGCRCFYWWDYDVNVINGFERAFMNPVDVLRFNWVYSNGKFSEYETDSSHGLVIN